MDERLQRAPIGVIEVAGDGTVTGANDAARRWLGADPIGDAFGSVCPRSVEDTLRDAVAGDVVEEVATEEYYPDLDRWLSVSVAATDGGATVYVEDVTERRRTEQTVERLRDERDRTALVDDLLSDVLAALVGASSRDEIAETICETLGETTLYEFAWVGERAAGSDDLAVRDAAGDTGETFAAVRDAVDGGATTAEERAVETGRLQVAHPIADDAGVPEPVRVAAFADGVQSLVAIPLVHGSTVHGVVGAYASGRDGFSERERASFETLGEVAGFAVSAVRNRNLLLSDAVTEVTFAVGDGAPLAALRAAIDGELALEGLVPRGDDGLLCYVAVAGDPPAIADAAADVASVGDVRVVDESGDGGTVEVAVDGSGPLLAASSLGGTVRRATFEGGSGEVVVDLPPDGDVRRMAAAVGRDCDAEVVAKRERERSVTTAREFRDELADRLTERQETALRTAYLADYFESPRGSSAETVADALDITGSTLLYHLRASQRKLLDAFFEDADGAE